MHQLKQRYFLTAAAFLVAVSGVLAQQGSADFMRETGKIYVVVAVLATILIALLIFLAWIDRRVRKIEKSLTNEHDKNRPKEG